MSTSRFCTMNLVTSASTGVQATVLPGCSSPPLLLCSEALPIVICICFCFVFSLKSCLIWVFVESHVSLQQTLGMWQMSLFVLSENYTDKQVGPKSVDACVCNAPVWFALRPYVQSKQRSVLTQVKWTTFQWCQSCADKVQIVEPLVVTLMGLLKNHMPLCLFFF